MKFSVSFQNAKLLQTVTLLEGGDRDEDFEHTAHGTMYWLSLLFPGLRPSGAQAAFLG
jgi:hypothetical protein